jgi:hypothetical protein
MGLRGEFDERDERSEESGEARGFQTSGARIRMLSSGA